MLPPHIHTIFWDWNGTLMNDVHAAHEVLQILIERRGLPALSLERYRQIYRHPIIEIYQELGFDLEKEPYDMLASEWHELYAPRSLTNTLHHDALPTLEHLAQQGMRQFVLSALPHDILHPAVVQRRIAHFFDEILGLAHSLGDGKIENAHDLVARHKLDPKQVLVIGDSTHDAEVAQAIGAHCVLVSRGFEDRDRLQRHGYPVVEGFGGLLR